MEVLGRPPTSVAVLGCGPLPETTIWIADWAQANHHDIYIHNVEVVESRMQQARVVCSALGIADNMTFETGDAHVVPRDLKQFEVVYFNAAVGSTEDEKVAIILDFVARMSPGALLVTRSTHALKTMAYPVSILPYEMTLINTYCFSACCHAVRTNHAKTATNSHLVHARRRYR